MKRIITIGILLISLLFITSCTSDNDLSSGNKDSYDMKYVVMVTTDQPIEITMNVKAPSAQIYRDGQLVGSSEYKDNDINSIISDTYKTTFTTKAKSSSFKYTVAPKLSRKTHVKVEVVLYQDGRRVNQDTHKFDLMGIETSGSRQYTLPLK